MFANHLLTSVTAAEPSPPAVDHSRCLRMRYAESSCEHCTAACPSHAIDLSDGLQLHTERCTGCLACTTTCPSGALESSTDFTPLLQAVAQHHHDTFVLGCSRHDANPAHQRLPCLGMLALEHLVTLSAFAASELQLDVSRCPACPASGMLETLERHIAQAATLQPSPHPIRLIHQAEQLRYQQEALDRRGFFNSFRRLAGQGARLILQPAVTNNPALSYADKRLPRRQALLVISKESLAPAAAAELLDRQLSFTPSCTACQCCVRVCPTGALTTVTLDQQPEFLQEHCTGCGLCVEFCLEQAIQLSPTQN